MVGQSTDGQRVICFECNPNREFKALSGHLVKHAMSLDEYRQKWALKQNCDPSDIYVGWTVADSPGYQARQANVGSGSPNTPAPTLATYNPVSGIAASLAPSELEEYSSRFAILYKQADEDPALITHIRDIVLGEIYVSRYQDQIAQITTKMVRGKNWDAQDAIRLEALNKLVMQVQSQNLKTMSTLNLTREKKQKNQVSIESTPSRLVTAYERFLASLTPDQFERNEREEIESVSRLHTKGKMIRDMAPIQLSSNL